MRQLLKNMKKYIEESEEAFDDEWGLSRTSKEMESLKLMPELYYDILKKIEEYK